MHDSASPLVGLSPPFHVWFCERWIVCVGLTCEQSKYNKFHFHFFQMPSLKIFIQYESEFAIERADQFEWFETQKQYCCDQITKHWIGRMHGLQSHNGTYAIHELYSEWHIVFTQLQPFFLTIKTIWTSKNIDLFLFLRNFCCMCL